MDTYLCSKITKKYGIHTNFWTLVACGKWERERDDGMVASTVFLIFISFKRI